MLVINNKSNKKTFLLFLVTFWIFPFLLSGKNESSSMHFDMLDLVFSRLDSCSFPVSIPVTVDFAPRQLEFCVGKDTPAQIAGEFCYKNNATDVKGCYTLFQKLTAIEKHLLAINPGVIDSDSWQHILKFEEPDAKRIYSTRTRVYIELKLVEFGNNPTHFNSCVFSDFNSHPSWCGKVPYDHYDSAVYLKPGEFPPGPHILMAKVDACSSLSSKGSKVLCIPSKQAAVSPIVFTFFNAAEVEISPLTILGEDQQNGRLFLQFDLSNYDTGAGWKLCVLVNSSISSCLSSLHLQERYGFGEGYQQSITRSIVTKLPSFPAGVHYINVVVIDKHQQALALSGETSFQSPTPSDQPASKSRLLGVSDTFQSCKEEQVPLKCILRQNEWGYFSQNGEDGILQWLLTLIDPSGSWRRGGFFVEFGTENGVETNTRLLYENYKWKGLMMDADYENSSLNLHRNFITAENIMDLFARYDVPEEFEVLSIDIDYSDFWVWRAIVLPYRPWITIVEYNSHLDPTLNCTVPYNIEAKWDGKTAFYGASLGSFVHLAKQKGYIIIYCESHGVNCFFVREDLLQTQSGILSSLLPSDMEGDILLKELYNPPNFFNKGWSYPQESKNSEWFCLES